MSDWTIRIQRWWRMSGKRLLHPTSSHYCRRCGLPFNDWFVWLGEPRSPHRGPRYCWPCYAETGEIMQEWVLVGQQEGQDNV